MKARPINLIVVHCSASEWGSRDAIDKWHKDRGWNGIGYNYVITNGRKTNKNDFDLRYDGRIENGRPLDQVPAHVKGLNSHSIGICLIGNHHFTKQQFAVLNGLLLDLMDGHEVALDRVVGHCELDSGKTCPNFDMDVVRSELRESMTLVDILTGDKKNE